MGVFFFCGLRCFCLWKLRRDINGDKDAGCVFWFRRIKAFTQTKCGPISGCKFSSQIKAFPFSHPQVGYFVTAVDNDEMCVFAAHLRFFLGRNAIYGSWDTNLWSLPKFVAWWKITGRRSQRSLQREIWTWQPYFDPQVAHNHIQPKSQVIYIRLAKMFANMPIFGRYLCVCMVQWCAACFLQKFMFLCYMNNIVRVISYEFDRIVVHFIFGYLVN